MRINGTYLLREAGGSHFLVPFGQTLVDGGKMMQLNETGAFFWELLQKHLDKSRLLNELYKEYEEVDKALLEADLNHFLASLKERNILSDN